MDEEETATVSEEERARMTEWRALMVLSLERGHTHAFTSRATSSFGYFQDGWPGYAQSGPAMATIFSGIRGEMSFIQTAAPYACRSNGELSREMTELLDLKKELDFANRIIDFVHDLIGHRDDYERPSERITADLMLPNHRPSAILSCLADRGLLDSVGVVVREGARVLFDETKKSQWPKQSETRHREKPPAQRKIFQRSNGQKRQCNGRTNRGLKNGK